MTPEPEQSAGEGSLLRVLAGVVMIIVALTAATLGFVRLVNILDGGGYGTTSMRQALIIIGVAGGLLAGGVATLIWDIAKRYENK